MTVDARLVMTVMVRDEADIIAAMIEHHLAQGVDVIIVTDNGSIDGTREILARYEDDARVEILDHPVHDKNQSAVVSSMASRAKTVHDADWVINADADEFFVPVDPALTLKQAFNNIPTKIGAFSVPVTNLTGVPAARGVGLARLIWRDERDEDSLMATVALHAHPTPDVVHVGREGITVQQGNHGVNIRSTGKPDPQWAIESLHVPWRSYAQYSGKVERAGRAYESNPELNPSPRHHGMRDYRFWKAGILEQLYLVRHPGENPGAGFTRDSRVIDGLNRLLAEGTAVNPDLLTGALAVDDVHYSDAAMKEAQAVARIAIPLEIEHLQASTRWRDLYKEERSLRFEAAREAAQATRERDVLAARPAARLRRFAGRIVRGLKSKPGDAPRTP